MRLEIENAARIPKAGEHILVIQGGKLLYGPAADAWAIHKATAIIVVKNLDEKHAPTHGCQCGMSDEWHKAFEQLTMPSTAHSRTRKL